MPRLGTISLLHLLHGTNVKAQAVNHGANNRDFAAYKMRAGGREAAQKFLSGSGINKTCYSLWILTTRQKWRKNNNLAHNRAIFIIIHFAIRRVHHVCTRRFENDRRK
jgi:hypothetical protein